MSPSFLLSRLAVLGIVLLVAPAQSAFGAATGAPQSIAIPSYFEPDYTDASSGGCGTFVAGNWATLERSYPTIRTAIINPNSGPGSARSWDYVCQTNRSRSTGIKVIGYVATTYANKPMSEVKAEIDRYYQWYGVDGIFLDEVTSDCDQPHPDYYAGLKSYVRSKGGTAMVVLNHGTIPEGNCYVNAGDIFVTFEGSYSTYAATAWPTSSWMSSYGADRFWHLVYETAPSQLAGAIALSKARRAGWVYATDDALPNPWDAVPSYWASEVARLPRVYRWRASNDATTTSFRYFFNAPWTVQRVYVDNDRSTATGFRHAGIGANYLIQNSGLYRYVGTGTNWSWSMVTTVTPVRTADSVSWRVGRADIGETGFPGSAYAVFENDLSVGPRSTSPRYTHTFGATTGSILSYSAENDIDTVYYQATITAPYAFNHVFIDTDLSSSTGYPVAGVGSDYMIENSRLYRYAGVAGGWAWRDVGAANRTISGQTSTWAISRASIGETRTGETSRLVFHGGGGPAEYATPVYGHVFGP